MIRKALPSDIDAIEKSYDQLFDSEDANGTTTNWLRGKYPSRMVPELAVPKGQMFVLEDDDDICASMMLNSDQGPGYEVQPWEVDAEDDEVLVIHTLVVSPLHGRRGYGQQMLDFAMGLVRSGAFKSIRIDTWLDNEPAKAFYSKNNFRIVGQAHVVHWGVIEEDQVFLEWAPSFDAAGTDAKAGDL